MGNIFKQEFADTLMSAFKPKYRVVKEVVESTYDGISSWETTSFHIEKRVGPIWLGVKGTKTSDGEAVLEVLAKIRAGGLH